MATRADIDKQLKLLHTASDQALKELNRLLNSREIKALSREALQESLKLYLPSLVNKYGKVAATASAEWYAELRQLAGATSRYTPRLASPVATDFINFAIDKIFDRATDKLEEQIKAQVDQWIRQQAQETIFKNALRDPAVTKFARVPKGATCAWCTMLASRGWVYATAQSAGKLRQYHRNCDCMIVPSWGAKDPVIKGYDPDALYADYKKARFKNASTKEILERMRQQHPERYTDGKWPKLPTGRSKDGTLMLAKYEQYRRELKKLRYALGKDGDPRFLIPPPQPAEAPKNWPTDLPILSDQSWNHILYGDVDEKPETSELRFRGGHKSGYGWASGGTEFPPEWEEQKIQDALIAGLRDTNLKPGTNPCYSTYQGQQLVAYVSLRTNSTSKILTFHPLPD